MGKNISNFYEDLLFTKGFNKIDSKMGKFNPMGQTWKLSNELGYGYYWVYSKEDLFDIKIHDFFFHDDFLIECILPECLSITYYKSVSGDELCPYRRINANCVKTYLGGKIPFRALIHKKIPIKSIGIEITPEYYENYLKKKYPDEYLNPKEAFLTLNESTDFPEMILLLKQIKLYKGTGISAKIFYEAKIAEAISLVLDKQRTSAASLLPLSNSDYTQIKNVSSFINDHASFKLSLNQLSKIACMGKTKLKQSFKQVNNCTITEYIQSCRINHAEYLLSNTNLSISQIAETVGYTSASRFSEIFKRNIGILPKDYRKLLKSNKPSL
ncbi:MAG: helix-turn-helix transcriptional regulator [Clostridium sp.]|jgi:AraC-like DNA-binding protein|uniref:helix-turn-helix transcriptional regulator n=1 Tax=Clostridium sp. TaxID=1506 RepID=UPI0025C489CC|nr:helix-turn-helix transcriptional regulator [Clostridium sp.]MCH3963498.1 helix-turn-helix transcriptional regulator [Clostridium sp.]MCI1714639.1 helix-turn-helix transcriptional regulator [Clostridium sp.]MCI1799172.1 helix-turn-helix transcriptional regulator [Clostridium sp.]MCI1812822.1 helix-turn-helix transcriptional regulator [Clostridium sp.]MCI1869712.1 helix-turn-helix transcriptional regulator [Clostridium sp.]